MIIIWQKPEIILSWMPTKKLMLRHWIFSVLYNNDEKMLYFSLTFFGLSVTIQKKKRFINDMDYEPNEKPEI